MGVRSRLSKVFGNLIPAQMQAGEQASQMTPASPFSPGEPIGPYDGFSRTPRTRDYPTGYNIDTRPRSQERVAFPTLKGLVEAYDVAQMCIWHRIDSIRSLDWSLIPADGHQGDVSDAIALGMAALAKPDRDQLFGTWLASYLYDLLAYDAGALYRLRNRRGDAIGLRVVDGTTIAPLLDYWGNTPQDPAPSFVQYAQGLPWNWLTTKDLVYAPYRKRSNSIYGTAPLESILLNANTDLRFQQYFLQRFTEGNIPEAFASAPESWTPQQIEDFQTYWDAFMLGDQAGKHQIKWLPGGSSLAWSNEKDFTDTFSLFLMRKTAAAFHVVPSDLGFTETVNLSSSESQGDVQHRVGDLPLIRHLQHILTAFLQEDLHLPVKFAFDLGEEQADRAEQAQADQIYVQMGALSPSEVREMRYGLPEPDGQPVPRFIYSTREGPIPLSALYAVAGPVDPQTAAPLPGAPLPHTVFGGVPGTMPNPQIKIPSLAEQQFGPKAMPLAPPPQPEIKAPSLEIDPAAYGLPEPAAPVTKDGGGAPAGAAAAPAGGASVTASTGITGYDLDGRKDDEDDEDGNRAQAAKAEMVAFRRFAKARRRQGQWRDFTFRHVDPITGHRLNDTGRLTVRKAAGQVAVAGLAVHAADTGRILMLQRALAPDDPAAGMWELPGGHLEGAETPLQGAWREWAEETGSIPPPGEQTGTWTSPDGIYQGIVWTVPSETFVPINGGRDITNPDDPDGDQVEAIAWWDPDQLPGNPAVRPELLASLTDVLTALGCPPDDGGGEALLSLAKQSAVPGLTKRSGMISLDLPDGTIPTVPGGPTDHHITVVYLGPDLSDEEYANACARAQAAAAEVAGPLVGTVAGIDSFEPSAGSDGKVPAFAPVVLPGIEILRAALEDLSASEHQDHHPHVTLTYLDEGDPLPAAVPPTLVTFTSLTVHWGADTASFPLGALPVEKATAGKGDAPSPGAPTWPGWTLDEKCADHWAPLIATALTRALSVSDADRLARTYLAEHPADGGQTGKEALNATAAAWLAGQGLDLATPLVGVLEGVFTDAYLIGVTSAHAMVDGGRPKVGAWTPGDTAAAREVIDSLNAGDGLAELLATVPDEAQAIADGCLYDLGRQLADSAIAAAGTVAKGRIGNALRGRLADIRRAASTALTAVTRGSGRAAVTTYAARGVAMGQWLIDPGGNVCPTCEANAAAGLVPIGQPFPSGDTYPPAHPNCRCALANA